MLAPRHLGYEEHLWAHHQPSLIWRLSVRREKPPSLGHGDAGFQPGAVLGPGQNAAAVSQPYEQLVRHSSQMHRKG